MKYYRFPDNKLTKVCFPLFLLALQMVARSTMYTSTIIGFGLSQAIMIGLVLLIGTVFLIVNRRNLKEIFTDSRMLFLGVSVLAVLMPMLIKQDWQLMYFSILLCWLFGIFLTYFTTVQELGRQYVLIMTVLAGLSLVGLFFLKPLVHAGVLPGNPFSSPGGWHMFNFGLTFVCDMNEQMQDTLRTFGIFREPGLYQIFLFVAIHLNNYWVQWKRQWCMWVVDAILFAALLTTFATGGVIALALYIVFLFFDKGIYKNKKLRMIAVILVVAMIAALVIALVQNGTWATELVWMIQKIFARSDSYTSRVDSVLSDARYFLSSPLYGVGLAEVLYSVTDNTATSPILFAVLGILGGCIHVLSWVAFAWRKERHWMMNLILMVILFMPFNTQNVIHDMFFWLFPLMALTQWCLPMLENWKRKRHAD